MSQDDPPPTSPGDDTQPVKDLLAEHVPLALVVDLVTPEATSTEILEAEGLPDVAWWEPPVADAAAAPDEQSPPPDDDAP